MAVANTVGKVACVKRFDLLVAKYPGAEAYLRAQLSGQNLDFFKSSRAKQEQQAVGRVPTRTTSMGTRET
jgi:hypothetical protein